MTEADREQARRLLAAGKVQVEVARLLGVHPSTIARLVRGAS